MSKGNPAAKDTKGWSYDGGVTHPAHGPASAARGWTFLTNHARVLIAVARDPNARVRDIADSAGITERAAHTIVADLEVGGYLHHARIGRRNHYTVNPAGSFRHPAEEDHRIGDLLALFNTGAISESSEH